MKLMLRFTLLLFLAQALSGCSVLYATVRESAPLDQRLIRVVATTGMVADVVQHVGGSRLKITQLMGAGVDPHLYKPSERNVIALAEADIIFYSGLHLEAKTGEVFEKIQGRIRAVAVTDGMDRSQLSAPPEFAGNYDPHVWFDVRLWSQTVKVVRDALSNLDPVHASQYTQNAAAYLAELQELDEYVRSQAARLPADRRVLITAHDAFGYFGRAYGFEVRGLQGISTVAEAGLSDLQSLAAFIAERKIPAIFVESSVPPKTVEALQAAVRARGFDVRIGGELFSDAMGDPRTPEGSYLGMVRHNIDTIVGALGVN